MALFSSLEAAAFDSPIMQKEKERERERESATSPLIKAKVEGNAVVHKRNGALGHQSDGRTLCLLSVIQEAEKELVAKHAMTNDSWNGKERRREREREE